MASADGLPKWDPKQMYDISEAEKRALEQRAQMRAKLKAEFRKKVSNPFRGTDGYIFDPAVQRYVSMRANHWDYFKATPKTFAFAMATVWVPIIALGYWANSIHKKQEVKLRTGQIPYKDREWKFVY